MSGRFTCVSALQGFALEHTVLRNIGTFFLSRRYAAGAATQTLPDDISSARPYEDIPGPKPLPVLGNALRFIPGIGELAELPNIQVQRSLYKQYGKIMKLTKIPLMRDIVILFNGDDVAKVFRNEGPWPIRDVAKSVTYYRLVTRKDIFQGVGGLLVTQGEEWQKFRTKVNQIMMQPRSTKLYVGPIDSVASDFINRVRALRDDKDEMPADFGNEIHKWALESIVCIALDTRLGCLKGDLEPDSEPQKLIDAVHILFDTMDKLETGLPIWKYISTPAWRAFEKSANYFIEVELKYINEAMQRLKSLPEDPDRELTVLEKLLARDPDPKIGIVMALDMIGAGVDTTSYSVTIALNYLAKYPEKQQILFEEIKKFLPEKDQPITSDILNELKYLKACIKESMRLSPVIFGNHRRLIKDLELGGYRVPKGTDIIMPFVFLSNEERYFEEADKFIPERWLKDGRYSNMKMHSFVTLPFGFGPRMCVGRRFAELEIDTLVTKIIRNFKVSYHYGEMKFLPKILYTPASPLKFKMEDREA